MYRRNMARQICLIFMSSEFNDIYNQMLSVLTDKAGAIEFVVNELSLANKGSIEVRNFAKSKGVALRDELPILELDSPNILFSKLIGVNRNFKSSLELRFKIIDSIMAHFEIGNYESQSDRNLIKEFCFDKKINELVHFTKIENVRNVFDLGLNSKSYNREIAKGHKYNDLNRFDLRTNTVSLSISYPNDKMFYKYRVENRAQRWAVLRLSPAILWELECLFCPTNAANSVIVSTEDSRLRGFKALQKMFAGYRYNLRSCDPSNSQAEVLVRNHIPQSYIHDVVVEQRNDAEYLPGINVCINSDYFHNRDFALRCLLSK